MGVAVVEDDKTSRQALAGAIQPSFQPLFFRTSLRWIGVSNSSHTDRYYRKAVFDAVEKHHN
jgi:hypothetical protein